MFVEITKIKKNNNHNNYKTIADRGYKILKPLSRKIFYYNVNNILPIKYNRYTLAVVLSYKTVISYFTIYSRVHCTGDLAR